MIGRTSPPEPTDDLEPRTAGHASAFGVWVVLATTLLLARLALGGSISGTVADPSGTPLEGICVDARNRSGDTLNDVREARTGSAGSYVLFDLVAGKYRIRFSDCDRQSYITEWYNDKRDFFSADPVAVGENSEIQGIDAVLEPGGAITGSVTDETGLFGLETVCVYAYDESGRGAAWGFTAGFVPPFTGLYRLGGLRPGQYKLFFDDCYNRQFAGEWYRDQPYYSSATPVSVAQGSVTSDINAALAPGGRLSGQVMSTAGQRLADVCVAVGDADGNLVAQVMSSASGSYSVEPLPAGALRVYFVDCGSREILSERYLPEWYDGKPDFLSADPVTVEHGEESTGVDAMLALGGSISGRVTDSAGKAIAGACVVVLGGIDPLPFVDLVTTDESGTYAVGGLQTGKYRVLFDDCDSKNFAYEFYNDKEGFSMADLVSVAEGTETSQVNAMLDIGGKIRGEVTDESGAPLSLTCVFALDAEGMPVKVDVTRPGTGEYALGGLRAGTYRLAFHDCLFREYAYEWHADQPGFSSAQPLEVVTGGEISGINASLERGGSISGTVIADSGSGVSGVCAVVNDSEGRAVGGGASDARGFYRARGLRSGQYGVRFQDCNFPAAYYLPEWYDDKSTRAAANVVAVQQPLDTIGINADLATDATAPGSPSGVAASPGPVPGEITITWNAPSENGGAAVIHYRLYRRTSGGSEILRAQVSSETRYVDSGLSLTDTYSYRVTAVNAVGGEGPSSEEVCSTPYPQAPAPLPPTGSSCSSTVSGGSQALFRSSSTPKAGAHIPHSGEPGPARDFARLLVSQPIGWPLAVVRELRGSAGTTRARSWPLPSGYADLVDAVASGLHPNSCELPPVGSPKLVGVVPPRFDFRE